MPVCAKAIQIPERPEPRISPLDIGSSANSPIPALYFKYSPPLLTIWRQSTRKNQKGRRYRGEIEIEIYTLTPSDFLIKTDGVARVWFPCLIPSFPAREIH